MKNFKIFYLSIWINNIPLLWSISQIWRPKKLQDLIFLPLSQRTIAIIKNSQKIKKNTVRPLERASYTFFWWVSVSTTGYFCLIYTTNTWKIQFWWRYRTLGEYYSCEKTNVSFFPFGFAFSIAQNWIFPLSLPSCFLIFFNFFFFLVENLRKKKVFSLHT